MQTMMCKNKSMMINLHISKGSVVKYDVYDILYKEQFKIKLPLTKYVFSMQNIIILLLSYLFSDSFLSFCIPYILLSLFAYRFFFSLTRNGEQFDIFVLKRLGILARKIRLKKFVDKSK